MPSQSKRHAAGLTLYLVLCLVPLGIAALGPLPPGRGFWVEFGVACGFVALGVMGVQFIITARFPSVSMALGQDTLLRFHRVAGISGAGFVLAHPVILILASPRYAAFFDPRVNLPRALALVSVTVAVIAIIALSVWRARLAFKYEWWRLTHGLLAVFIMFIGIVHLIQVGHYSSPLMKQAAFVAVVGAPVAIFVHLRLIRPALAKRRPWRVASVEREIPRVWTVTLRPEGRRGMRFRPGQFCWITFGDNPWSLRQHPFTIASSAERPDELRFTIKQLGDFTDRVGEIRPGARAFLEGPLGDFIPPSDAPGIVFLAGGIGITPALAMIRTAVDREEQRPFTLFQATETLEKAAFGDELGAAAGRIPLRLIRVPEKPPEGWDGPSGFIDRAMIERTLDPATLRSHVFMICGPAPMMDAVEEALLEAGVDRARIKSERFDMI